MLCRLGVLREQRGHPVLGVLRNPDARYGSNTQGHQFIRASMHTPIYLYFLHLSNWSVDLPDGRFVGIQMKVFELQDTQWFKFSM